MDYSESIVILDWETEIHIREFKIPSSEAKDILIFNENTLITASGKKIAIYF